MIFVLSKPFERRICCALVGSALLFLCALLLSPSTDFKLDIILANQGSCEQVFPVEGFSMSLSYRLKSPGFNEAVLNASNKASTMTEGFSGQWKELYMLMHYLTGQSVARRVCETGFNLGHNSFNYLTANDHAVVHSFDRGSLSYTHAMADYLKKLFPTRFFIHFGDSTQTIREFIRNNPEFNCDFMFVDGGHVFPVALADLRNFAKIANLKRNIILFDDYPTGWGKESGKAWDEITGEGIVKELMRCSYTSRVLRWKYGFVIGRVVKRPR